MKLDCNRAAFSAALNVVASVIPGKTPKPVLETVLLTWNGERAELVGTDLEIFIRHEVADVRATSSGEVLLPAKRILDVLRESKDERITLDCQDKTLLLSVGRGRFNVPTMAASDFPPCTAIPNQTFAAAPGCLLRRMIRRTAFAIDTGESRYALNGVLFHFGSKDLRAVGTDSRRMSIVTGVYEVAQDLINTKAIVPVKTLNLLDRAITGTESNVQIGCTPNLIVYKTGQIQIASKLISGNFPRYEDVIPRSHNASVDLNVGELLSTLRQSTVFTNEESRGVNFDLVKGTWKLSSEAADTGASQLELPVGYDGRDVLIRLDPRLFIDALKTLPNETCVNVKLTDEDSPAVVATEDGSTFLLMPLAREV